MIFLTEIQVSPMELSLAQLQCPCFQTASIGLFWMESKIPTNTTILCELSISSEPYSRLIGWIVEIPRCILI